MEPRLAHRTQPVPSIIYDSAVNSRANPPILRADLPGSPQISYFIVIFTVRHWHSPPFFARRPLPAPAGGAGPRRPHDDIRPMSPIFPIGLIRLVGPIGHIGPIVIRSRPCPRLTKIPRPPTSHRNGSPAGANAVPEILSRPAGPAPPTASGPHVAAIEARPLLALGH
jgi:hypothetical protein